MTIDSTRELQALYPNSFDCIGDMQGEYDIKTDPTVPPVQHGRRKVPIEYKEEIKKELAEMVCQRIITKQTEPTPWVSSLTYPKKANGKLRKCLDPKDLNKAIIITSLSLAMGSLTNSIGMSFTSMFPHGLSTPMSISDDSSDVMLHAPSLLSIITN